MSITIDAFEENTMKPSEEGIKKAVAEIRAGRLVSFPTETVYGLGADAENQQAVDLIFKTKGRPSNNPLIVHVANVEIAQRYAIWNEMADILADKFWPGPMTMVLPLKDNAQIAKSVLAGKNTIGLRLPSHIIARYILKEFGKAIAAPSANLSGKISPTRAHHVEQEFKEKELSPAIIMDGGSCNEGVESTIIDCTKENPEILRFGSILTSDLQRYFNEIKSYGNNVDNIKPASPGMFSSHYSPNANLRLNVLQPENGEAYLDFGSRSEKLKQRERSERYLNLSPKGDIKEAAHNLFDYLRKLDNIEVATIAVAPIPYSGIGVAIMDRLQRAAAS